MWAIALLSLRRSREPATLILLVFGAVLSFLVHGSETFEIGSVHGVAGTSLLAANQVLLGTLLLVGLGVLLVIFTGATEIPRDIHSRAIFMLLSKPLSRRAYVTGKFLGVLLLAAGSAAGWITLMLLCRAGLARDALSLRQALAQYQCLLVLLPITGLAICASCCFGDLLSMIVSVTYLLLCFAGVILPVLASLSPGGTGKFLLVIYFFFPNLSLYAQSSPNAWAAVAAFVYAAATAGIFLIVSNLVFEQGDVR